VPPIRHIVYECLPGAYAGGVQKMVFELASAQRRSGADVEIWTPDAVRAGSTEIFAGLPIRYFYPDPLFGLARSHRLSRELATLPSDAVLHAHNTFNPLNVQVGRAATARGLKVFYHPHGALDPALFADWSFKSLKKRLYIRFFTRPKLNRATGVFALTSLEQAQLASLGVTSAIHVVPNGIRPVTPASRDDGLALRARHGVGPTDRVVLFVGRITAKKRIEDIIQAVARSDAHLFIAGNSEAEPDYAALLRAEANAAGCTARLHWLGFMDEAAKSVAYASADVFVHASESEGMALAILEAMSAGLPVVATRGCYMAEAAAAGALVECTQGTDALAQAMAPLLTDAVRAQAQGEAGRVYVGRVHDWSAIARRTLEIYASQGGPA
jgi:glycosyltransferase involved in cell wall biosynthesis